MCGMWLWVRSWVELGRGMCSVWVREDGIKGCRCGMGPGLNGALCSNLILFVSHDLLFREVYGCASRLGITQVGIGRCRQECTSMRWETRNSSINLSGFRDLLFIIAYMAGGELDSVKRLTY